MSAAKPEPASQMFFTPVKRIVQSLAFASILPAFCLSAAFPDIKFEAALVEYHGIAVESLTLEQSANGALGLQAERVDLKELGRTLNKVSLAGTLHQGGSAPAFSGRLVIETHEVGLKLRQEDGFQAELGLHAKPLAELSGFQGLPDELAWFSRGLLNLVVKISVPAQGSAQASYEILLDDLAFDSPDGRFAGEAMFLSAAGAISLDKPFRLGVQGEVRSGELLIDNFYRDFSDAALSFELSPQLEDTRFDSGPILLSDGNALTVRARASGDVQDPFESWGLEIGRLEMNFPAAYQRYMEAMAGAWTLDGLVTSGKLSWSGTWKAGVFQSGDLRLNDLSVVDAQLNRFAFTGLEAHHRPGDHNFDSSLNWRGLLFGPVNLGPGKIALDSDPGSIALLQPLSLDVFDGRFDIHELKIVLPGSEGARSGEPEIRLRANLQDLDMERVTEAMGWPAFAGKISGEIPGVQMHQGVLEVDGGMLVQVFDGAIAMEDLRIERPFGVLPSLAANITVTDLDLESLTSTFSFGQISGRLDGYVRELRMLDWRPVAFEAWLGTPERQKQKNDISRKAVNKLTTIGGGSATTALTSPIMRLFSNFSYRRLGLGCVLQNNVCEIRGIGEDDVSVLILEGAGIPKITIRAFNRNVDWQQMVSNLLAISGEESIRVGN